ncbi:MAG: hypothetical protein KatS3mg110_4529 [Pirellulaceae bacterium]|nr:MAG: hypothetical protein KatS3mg110_4529 [Pirellulaceae bacterium]
MRGQEVKQHVWHGRLARGELRFHHVADWAAQRALCTGFNQHLGRPTRPRRPCHYTSQTPQIAGRRMPIASRHRNSVFCETNFRHYYVWEGYRQESAPSYFAWRPSQPDTRFCQKVQLPSRAAKKKTPRCLTRVLG